MPVVGFHNCLSCASVTSLWTSLCHEIEFCREIPDIQDASGAKQAHWLRRSSLLANAGRSQDPQTPATSFACRVRLVSVAATSARSRGCSTPHATALPRQLNAVRNSALQRPLHPAGRLHGRGARRGADAAPAAEAPVAKGKGKGYLIYSRSVYYSLQLPCCYLALINLLPLLSLQSTM